MVPYWDFDAPRNSTIPYQPRDTSAATIFSSGLVELSQYVTDATTKDKFLSSAKAIVDQLTTPAYLILGKQGLYSTCSDGQWNARSLSGESL